MSARLRALMGVSLMSVLLVLYFVAIGVRAVALLSSASVLAITMGLALLVLPLFGAWALGAEILFGYRATRLTDRLAANAWLPAELLSDAQRPVLREHALAAIPAYRQAAQADSTWQTQLRLALILDAAGDRKSARAATRQAIVQSRN